MDKAEHVCEVGYINDEMKHVLISIQHPTLTNVCIRSHPAFRWH